MADLASLRRLPLRQLLTSCDKTTRDLHELIHTDYLPRVSDARDLSRPVRRRSHYPTMTSLQNGLHRLQETAAKVQKLATSLQEHLDVIRDHAQREKVNRKR